ncbi:DUF397 domain-containing protein (plasmid) [Streptomyces sp. NBC_00161]|uniref:DUF397 domain-containing protein n=1 Tax=Streptomyces sp. NBC_00161 TaxID=2975671 RepID=UPI002F90E96E
MASLNAADLGDVEWRKSSYSGGGESQCVEVADLSATRHSKIAVRDSKRPTGPALLLSASAFGAFVHLATAQAV